MMGIKLTWMPILVGAIASSSNFFPVLVWPKWIWAPATIFSFAIVLLFVIARRARILETPKLRVMYGNDRIFKVKTDENLRSITTIRIGIQNVSNVPLHGVEVLIANMVSEDELIIHDINRNLIAENFQHPKIIINPGDIKYYTIARFIEPPDIDSLSAIELLEWARSDAFDPHVMVEDIRLENVIYKLKIRICAENSPLQTLFFKIGTKIEAETAHLIYDISY